MAPSWLPALLLTLSAVAHAGAVEVAHDHAHEVRAPLPDSWHHPRHHPIHALFRRQNGSDIPTDGTDYPQVGSPTWSAAYPSSTPDANSMPQAWKDALNAAVKAGKIPDYPPSTEVNGGNPTYGNGLDPNGPDVCSGTEKCKIPGDIWDAPDGMLGCGFDDGPLPPADILYPFLQEKNIHATHFFIGVNILNNPQQFLRAFETNQDEIAVHTWTHPYMTTLSNEDVMAQLAWTMQIIHDSTGGRVPKFWRGPYGDTDTRVHAIATEVLGMTGIFWNQDTEDWSLTSGGTTAAKIHDSMEKWLTGPKHPGLIILEHELSNESVQAFIDAYPIMVQNNWNIVSAALLDGLNKPYQNAVGTIGAVTKSDILVSNATANPSSASNSPASSSSPSSSAPSSQSSGASGNDNHSNNTGGTSDSSQSQPGAAVAMLPSVALAMGTVLFSIAAMAGYLR